MESLRFLLTSTFYPPYHLGGDAVHVQYLASALARRGHEVHVMHSLDAFKAKAGKDLPAPIDNVDGVHIHTLKDPMGKMGVVLNYSRGRSGHIEKEYQQLLKTISPDVVHHHNISLLGHTILKRQGNYSQLYTAHDYWLICQNNDLLKDGQICSDSNCTSCSMKKGKPPQLWRKNMSVEDIDHLICPSHFMARYLKVDAKKVVMHNFAPDPPKDIPSYRIDGGPSGRKNIPSECSDDTFLDNGFLLFLGALEKGKGIVELLNGIAKTDHHIVIGGDGSMRQWVEQRIQKDDLKDKVRYLGWVDDKWSLLKDAKALILPSLYNENCPMVGLEAMAVGTPMICSDRGGAHELVEESGYGLVLDSSQLESSIASLGPVQVDEKALMEHSSSNLSEDAYIKRYLQLIGGDGPSI